MNRHYKQKKRLENKKTEFTNSDLNKFVIDLVYKYPFINRRDVKSEIYKKFKINIKLNKVTKLYKYLKLTYKKPK